MDDVIGNMIMENFGKRCLIGLPLQQVVYEGSSCDLGGAVLVGSSTDLLDRIRLVSTPAQHWEFKERGYKGDWHKTAITGVTLTDIEDHCFLLFPQGLDWEQIAVVPQHEYQMSELVEAQHTAEKYLDVLRLDHCSLAKRHSIPGTPGMLNGRSNFSAAIFYSNNSDHEAHLFAGQTGTQMLISALGLEVNPRYEPTVIAGGVVGNIIRYALTWYRLALNTPSATQRFISMMIVLEFLADPENYTSSLKVAQTVSLHNAQCQTSYDTIKQAFDKFSGKGKSTPGLRTQIVHTGKRLEELIENHSELERIFQALESWMRKMLKDILPFSDAGWGEVEDFRQQRKRYLKIM